MRKFHVVGETADGRKIVTIETAPGQFVKQIDPKTRMVTDIPKRFVVEDDGFKPEPFNG